MAGEARVLTKCKDILKKHTCVVIRMSGANGIGRSDLVACINGVFIAIEVKELVKGSYGLTRAQKGRLRQVINEGGLAFAVDKENLCKLDDELKKRTVKPEAYKNVWGYEGDIFNEDKKSN